MKATYKKLFWVWVLAVTMFMMFTLVPIVLINNSLVQHKLIIPSGSILFVILIIATICGIGMGLVLCLFALATPENEYSDEGLRKLIDAGYESIWYWNPVGLGILLLMFLYRKMSSSCDAFIASEADPEP